MILLEALFTAGYPYHPSGQYGDHLLSQLGDDINQGAISCFFKVGSSCSHLSLARGVALVYSGLSESVAFGLMMHKFKICSNMMRSDSETGVSGLLGIKMNYKILFPRITVRMSVEEKGLVEHGLTRSDCTSKTRNTSRARLEISGIASQFAIQNERFAIHN